MQSKVTRFMGAALVFCAALTATPATAHARLVAAEPPINSTVSAPTSVRLRFSEALAKRFSSFYLENSNGQRIDLAPASADTRTLMATPARALASGEYTVSWTAVANSDGHRTTGRFRFTVR